MGILKWARVWCCVLPWMVGAALAADIQVAVAANFLDTLERLQPAFQAATGHRLKLSSGSSGQLYAQIRQGAPYDVLLSADTVRPAALVQQGLAVPESRFTYAVGRLVLWSSVAGRIDAEGRFLQGDAFRFIAIANPRSAPYGAAAQSVLQRLGLWDRLQDQRRIVTGESIAQTLQFVIAGSADAGFVALSQLSDSGVASGGSRWLPPPALYDPIRQDAVQLKRSKEPRAAASFLAWLRSDPAVRSQLQLAGYDVMP